MHIYAASVKWRKIKPGTWVIETVQGNNLKPRLFQFQRIIEETQEVELVDVVTDEIVLITGDDRYGKYPILDQARMDELLYRDNQLEIESRKYAHILNLIEKYVDANFRI